MKTLAPTPRLRFSSSNLRPNSSLHGLLASDTRRWNLECTFLADPFCFSSRLSLPSLSTDGCTPSLAPPYARLPLPLNPFQLDQYFLDVPNAYTDWRTRILECFQELNLMQPLARLQLLRDNPCLGQAFRTYLNESERIDPLNNDWLPVVRRLEASSSAWQTTSTLFPHWVQYISQLEPHLGTLLLRSTPNSRRIEVYQENDPSHSLISIQEEHDFRWNFFAHRQIPLHLHRDSSSLGAGCHSMLSPSLWVQTLQELVYSSEVLLLQC